MQKLPEFKVLCRKRTNDFRGCECIMQTEVDWKHLFNVCSLCYVAVAALETSLDSVEGSVVVLLAGCSENFLQDMGSWERDLVCFAVLCDVVVKAGKVIKIALTALVHTVFPESRRIPTPDTSSSGIRSLSSVLVETFFENEDHHSLQLCDHDTL